MLKVFKISPNATEMVQNLVRVAISALLMSADEVITVINLGTDLSLEPRDAECEMISWLYRIPPAEKLHPHSRSVCPSQHKGSTFAALTSFVRQLLRQIGLFYPAFN